MTIRTIRFFVPGVPAPQGSKRHLGNGVLVESSKRVKPWRTDVRHTAIDVMSGAHLLTGPLMVTLTFCFARPKSHYRTGKNAHLLKAAAPTAHTQRPDVDKLARAILDALTDAVWADDSQIVSLTAHKIWTGADPGVAVEVLE